MKHSKISGFSWAAPIQPETEWNDYNFVKFTLVLISPRQDKDFPTMANDLKDVQNNGWRWWEGDLMRRMNQGVTLVDSLSLGLMHLVS